MIQKRLFPLLGSLLLALSSCATSSASFVKHSPEMSVIRGEILHVKNLQSHEISRFSDGVALTVADQGCRVKIRLGKKNEQSYDVAPGTVLVFGKEDDYILRDAADYIPGIPSQ